MKPHPARVAAGSQRLLRYYYDIISGLGRSNPVRHSYKRAGCSSCLFLQHYLGSPALFMSLDLYSRPNSVLVN